MLYKFSVNAKEAVKTGNTKFLTQAFRFLDNHYKIIGIMTIISVLFLLISMISMFLGMRGFMMM